MNVTLRPCAAADLDELYRLDQTCFRAGISYSRPEIAYFLRRSDFSSMAATDDSTGAIQGFVIAEWTRGAAQPSGHLITIDVAPGARRRGIGSLLLREIERELSGHAASFMRLEVAADNEAAQSFYRGAGYRQTGRIAGYYLGTLDALVMEKELTAC